MFLSCLPSRGALSSWEGVPGQQLRGKELCWPGSSAGFCCNASDMQRSPVPDTPQVTPQVTPQELQHVPAQEQAESVALYPAGGCRWDRPVTTAHRCRETDQSAPMPAYVDWTDITSGQHMQKRQVVTPSRQVQKGQVIIPASRCRRDRHHPRPGRYRRDRS